MLAYEGSNPYCYTHSLSMVLGSLAPPPAVIETLTCSPFGVELVGGATPLFDPYGWDPEIGVDTALDLLGWRCQRHHGGTPEQAVERLRAACAQGPVMVGPVDMGLLLYQPESGAADGADHYVVVLAVEDDTVVLHDPHGHPFATLPTEAFLAAWRAEAVPYVDTSFVMRTDFAQEREVSVGEALRTCLPQAIRWLEGRDDRPMPPGSLGGAAALQRLAVQVEQGLDPEVRAMLAVFAVRVGARRLAGAARCLALLGLSDPAGIAAEQARLLGSAQYPLVARDDQALARVLRQLAPTYERLRDALTAAVDQAHLSTTTGRGDLPPFSS
ncbi:Butirosin biosynthesis protein H, N-terminal [Streptoalloteichus tenebrarius]|uniref:Butirosin biosynthesis protein H, N-terminal n=1 Tax=Streptoalloteichus tenebrarius (strain ATCC 17920 / DSM 40477 / JCM 4838 / CBS 697.72 / NBRC 16177 / NCIMB 11028 / NRRL B-12390 / A12253. 1 / ISP 5477) TaxID=1933 RepID=A0ABT1HPV0_STRSD|nr:hypothetical protein [Streptoalloteichus tenebrarius]MCP2257541.1 Butirosin biosynthesis protein H, N-terminal [Streptoalloteichus tenebrarius]BFE98492.1 hypothetical protein GCM10020241_01680 [Streptoalloteichus tenebrarius]